MWVSPAAEWTDAMATFVAWPQDLQYWSEMEMDAMNELADFKARVDAKLQYMMDNHANIVIEAHVAAPVVIVSDHTSQAETGDVLVVDLGNVQLHTRKLAKAQRQQALDLARRGRADLSGGFTSDATNTTPNRAIRKRPPGGLPPGAALGGTSLVVSHLGAGGRGTGTFLSPVIELESGSGNVLGHGTPNDWEVLAAGKSPRSSQGSGSSRQDGANANAGSNGIAATTAAAILSEESSADEGRDADSTHAAAGRITESDQKEAEKAQATDDDANADNADNISNLSDTELATVTPGESAATRLLKRRQAAESSGLGPQDDEGGTVNTGGTLGEDGVGEETLFDVFQCNVSDIEVYLVSMRDLRESQCPSTPRSVDSSSYRSVPPAAPLEDQRFSSTLPQHVGKAVATNRVTPSMKAVIVEKFKIGLEIHVSVLPWDATIPPAKLFVAIDEINVRLSEPKICRLHQFASELAHESRDLVTANMARIRRLSDAMQRRKLLQAAELAGTGASSMQDQSQQSQRSRLERSAVKHSSMLYHTPGTSRMLYGSARSSRQQQRRRRAMSYTTSDTSGPSETGSNFYDAMSDRLSTYSGTPAAVSAAAASRGPASSSGSVKSMEASSSRRRQQQQLRGRMMNAIEEQGYQVRSVVDGEDQNATTSRRNEEDDDDDGDDDDDDDDNDDDDSFFSVEEVPAALKDFEQQKEQLQYVIRQRESMLNKLKSDIRTTEAEPAKAALHETLKGELLACEMELQQLRVSFVELLMQAAEIFEDQHDDDINLYTGGAGTTDGGSTVADGQQEPSLAEGSVGDSYTATLPNRGRTHSTLARMKRRFLREFNERLVLPVELGGTAFTPVGDRRDGSGGAGSGPRSSQQPQSERARSMTNALRFRIPAAQLKFRPLTELKSTLNKELVFVKSDVGAVNIDLLCRADEQLWDMIQGTESADSKNRRGGSQYQQQRQSARQYPASARGSNGASFAFTETQQQEEEPVHNVVCRLKLSGMAMKLRHRVYDSRLSFSLRELDIEDFVYAFPGSMDAADSSASVGSSSNNNNSNSSFTAHAASGLRDGAFGFARPHPRLEHAASVFLVSSDPSVFGMNASSMPSSYAGGGGDLLKLKYELVYSPERRALKAAVDGEGAGSGHARTPLQRRRSSNTNNGGLASTDAVRGEGAGAVAVEGATADGPAAPGDSRRDRGMKAAAAEEDFAMQAMHSVKVQLGFVGVNIEQTRLTLLLRTVLSMVDKMQQFSQTITVPDVEATSTDHNRCDASAPLPPIAPEAVTRTPQVSRKRLMEVRLA